jgi:hypothetical protein
MDITQITDVNQLKALAYDRIVALEQNQNDLRAINTRLSELAQQEANDQSSDKKEEK